ncbi:MULTISPECIES: vanadium-dependent haloperoxidase [Flectobacillus]|uniref:Vanadium-dependent haloperoxidase n=2 Tax=Bacteria TaxID=2 RepID=A0ABT6Y5C7_9BACT|nr:MULTISPECIES: vanadium-dependent haloperoxidase [Flectobacillus]MDI9858741.1 vanadium-dependent haloperoxidase [Flectobacillus roseus]NBA75922.1 phosphatase PAP2 family protein [Emticicia sp. ODNR4P]PAC32415.1 phosphatidic acid phosphatase [Flectobacillus sp. BAB-3569]
MKRLFLFVLLATAIFSCKKSNENWQQAAANPEFLRRTQSQLTESIIHDIFAPPVSSRIYMYSALAAYEALAAGNTNYQSMVGQLKGFKKVAKPEAGKEYSYPVAAVRAYLTIGKNLTFAQEIYVDFEKKLEEDYKATGIPSEVYERSIAFGDSIAASIMNYSKGDNYKQTRGFRYTVTQKKGTWVPTPPAYIDAAEPYWSKIRPATLDTSSQFMPPRPYEYDMTKGSKYYDMVMDVYNTINNLTEEQRNIANFWDCNPFKMNITGHAMFATKKVSPGGHWMAIVTQTSRQLKADIYQTSEAYLLTSMAIFDGFISCWDEKYRSIKVRPETVINELVDKNWQPVLQTPPFPEYTSGHSVISGAASVALSSVLGDNVAFADSSEMQYGLPVRNFKSYKDAAEEASISRLYGGIHFRPALDLGLEQGRKVGGWVITKVKTRKK